MKRHKFTAGRIELLGASLSWAAALGMYLATAAPGITWSNQGADGGDLLTAAFTWGIPHPSGYPTYLLALRVFSFLAPVGDEAFRGNLMSAFLAATAVALTFVVTARTLRLLRISDGAGPATLAAAAGTAALAFAFSRELWSQATITEVYALNAFFAALLLLLALTMYSREREGRDAGRQRTAAAFLLGVGLGNHLTLAFFAAPFAVWSYLWTRGGRSLRKRLLEWRPPAAFLLGLLIYAYAPLASARGPVLNWGHPEHPQGFWWMISGSIYQDYAFGLQPGRIPERIATSGDMLLAQFGFVGLVLAVVGVTHLWEEARGFLIASSAALLLVAGYAISYNTSDSFLYLIPLFLLVAVWIGVGALAIQVAVRRGLARLPAAYRRRAPAGAAQAAAVAAILVAAPGFSAYANFDSLDLSGDTQAASFATRALETAGPGSVVLARDPGRLFSLWYQSYVAQPEANVLIVSIPHLQFDWYWDDLRKQAPDRMPPRRPRSFRRRILAIADYNAGRGNAFVAMRDPRLDEEFTLVPDGDIFRIEP